jgi:group I intron endonuclease
MCIVPMGAMILLTKHGRWRYVQVILDLNTSVIYAIIDFQNDRFYIGSSVRGATHRFKEHLKALRKHTHANSWLQTSFDSSSILFIPFHVAIPSQTIAIEQQYLNEFFDGQVRCMNILAKADSWLGRKHTKESKAKISKANKGRKLPSVSLANKNRKISLKTREKLSAFQKGRRRGLSKRMGLPGHPHTEKTKQHLSDVNKKKYQLQTPDGVKFEVMGLTNFCRSNGLDPSALIRVDQGKQKSHKGWKCLPLN